MDAIQLEAWRSEVLNRLEALSTLSRQIQQFMDAKDIRTLEDKSVFEAAWNSIEILFPEDFHPNRLNDLKRHIHFAHRHDFSDIERLDVPAVMKSVEQYARNREAVIEVALRRLDFQSSASELIHPQIKDACADLLYTKQYTEAARTVVAILMDELRRLGEETTDGDVLIRKVIRTEPGKLAFSDCLTNNAKQVTEGFKLVAQGVYKGVRNPASHGWHGFGRMEILQIMVTCSLLLTRLQLVEAEASGD